MKFHLSSQFVCALSLAAAAACVLPLPRALAGGEPLGKTVREEVGVNIHFTDAVQGELDELGAVGFGFIRESCRHRSELRPRP